MPVNASVFLWGSGAGSSSDHQSDGREMWAYFDLLPVFGLLMRNGAVDY